MTEEELWDACRIDAEKLESLHGAVFDIWQDGADDPQGRMVSKARDVVSAYLALKATHDVVGGEPWIRFQGQVAQRFSSIENLLGNIDNNVMTTDQFLERCEAIEEGLHTLSNRMFSVSKKEIVGAEAETLALASREKIRLYEAFMSDLEGDEDNIEEAEDALKRGITQLRGYLAKLETE